MIFMFGHITTQVNYTCLLKFYFHCKSINLIFRLMLGFWIVDESSSSLALLDVFLHSTGFN